MRVAGLTITQSATPLENTSRLGEDEAICGSHRLGFFSDSRNRGQMLTKGSILSSEPRSAAEKCAAECAIV